jgi:hypothetical protein
LASSIIGTSLNVSGNVLASSIIGTSLNVSGNVLASGGVYNALTINGYTNASGINVSNINVGIGGFNSNGTVFATNFNSSGNVSAAIHMGGAVNVSGNVVASSLVGATGNIGNLNVNYSLGVGTSSYGSIGEIRATNNITAYYSDERLKTRLGAIENALDKVDQLSGFYHEANELAQSLGYTPIREVGVSAQDVQRVLPEIVAPAPIDPQYLTVRYERLTPLLIEAIKELRQEVLAIKEQINKNN